VHEPAMPSAAVAAVMAPIAAAAALLPLDRVHFVAVDGVDGAGKSVFAGGLGVALAAAGRATVRVSLDGFHNPATTRHARGRYDPDGFYEDSFDYARLDEVLLSPLRAGGSRRIRRAAYDVDTETPIDAPLERVPLGAVLVVDGLFLHRPQLTGQWDLSVWLDVPFEVTFARMAIRDGRPSDPYHAANTRSLLGQQRYLLECTPAGQATWVVDNTDPTRPRLLADRSG